MSSIAITFPKIFLYESGPIHLDKGIEKEVSPTFFGFPYDPPKHIRVDDCDYYYICKIGSKEVYQKR